MLCRDAASGGARAGAGAPGALPSSASARWQSRHERGSAGTAGRAHAFPGPRCVGPAHRHGCARSTACRCRWRVARCSASSANPVAARPRSGKTIVGIHRASSGDILFEGNDIGALSPSEGRALRRTLAILLSGSRRLARSALEDRPRAGRAAGDPYRAVGRRAARARARGAGGGGVAGDASRSLSARDQRRTAAPRSDLARILMLRPSLVILDEPTSGLDVSVQATVLRLFLDLRERFDLTYLFISHDLAVVRLVSQRIAVMYLGRVVEIGDTETVFAAPAPSLYAIAAGGGAGSRRAARHRGFLARGRAAQPRQPAQRLPLPHALPTGRGALRERRTGAAAARGWQSGGMSLRLTAVPLGHRFGRHGDDRDGDVRCRSCALADKISGPSSCE